MDRPAPGLRLEVITPPRQDIIRIWRTLRPVDRAFILGIIGDMDISTEADRLPFRIQWADSISTALARFLQIREIHRQRDASTIKRLYFPEHPTDEERAFSATSAYGPVLSAGIDIVATVLGHPDSPSCTYPRSRSRKLHPSGYARRATDHQGGTRQASLRTRRLSRGGRGLQGASNGVSSSTCPGRAFREGDGPFEREVGPSACKGARDLPPLGLAHAPVFALARTHAALNRPPSAKGCQLYV
ncbi:hypothetical protein CRG98_023219 [Punica granatum]|uniref:Uncharacterized protein n=1 Tax=Punica granatum TaxID=22663 RepID=A0A2I0JJE7_PUNGR|nr:hypothetical protein CRG98_023219 [Punica granatum]